MLYICVLHMYMYVYIVYEQYKNDMRVYMYK